MIPLDLANPLVGMAGMTAGIARPATPRGLGEWVAGLSRKRRKAPLSAWGELVHQFARDREELCVKASPAHAG